MLIQHSNAKDLNAIDSMKSYFYKRTVNARLNRPEHCLAEQGGKVHMQGVWLDDVVEQR
jgi:hypothetical protein